MKHSIQHKLAIFTFHFTIIFKGNFLQTTQLII